jgi:predicted phage tail protein
MFESAGTTMAALFHGGAAVPLIWIIGLVLIVGGVISMVRGGIAAGIILVILGIILGGLQVI